MTLGTVCQNLSPFCAGYLTWCLSVVSKQKHCQDEHSSASSLSWHYAMMPLHLSPASQCLLLSTAVVCVCFACGDAQQFLIINEVSQWLDLGTPSCLSSMGSVWSQPTTPDYNLSLSERPNQALICRYFRSGSLQDADRNSELAQLCQRTLPKGLITVMILG